MDEVPRFRLAEKLIAGGFLILLGALFILDNLHMIDAGRVWDYWPLFLIAPGLARLLQPSRPGQRISGGILVALGTIFLLRNLDIVWIPFHRVWPVALVVIGAYMIWQTVSAGSSDPGGPPSPGAGGRPFEGSPPGAAGPEATPGRPSVAQLNEFALCGGGNRLVQSSDFRGGTITVLAGGFDIDLRETAMARDGVAIEVFVMMGGVVLRVPESWKVIVNVTPLLGGTDMKARTVAPLEGPIKTLTINGFILMGGLEVKN
ncbi:MAG TPA: DUF5668 domain-containing protein [Thermoanaerobaculia bacterium]|jgi:predicted membrane protein|nr:DUF5668 domain-containing protein [Thermoanaerobaculia bacterium]